MLFQTIFFLKKKNVSDKIAQTLEGNTGVVCVNNDVLTDYAFDTRHTY